ncbi:hypothetical protein [Cyclobacterium marinum]|uniref:Uncharacterized protein n=1 Tax=Cyclobacterium marinum (strain ATCC 25205 / DSM 745 / LMG 13164 / NCIMB 1802) TaxID=880070 RepID=G0IXY9_CYCMS|nr:hypothetical protein [Cyclobacterium marinum]AEL24322.1 hypothetical protein Cycma_0547 [Cyclobacterium marinum DSM 745]
MNNLRISTEKLMELKRNLPHGAINEIANELGIHRNNVTDVFKGKWENDQVIDLAIQKIELKRVAIANQEARINKVLKG